MAEAVFRSLTNNLPSATTSSSSYPPHPLISHIDSAGTGAYHTLSPPDSRTLTTLASHNINGYNHGARKITARDFDEFDYIFAMDRQNLRDLEAMKGRIERKSGKSKRGNVRLFGEFGEKDDTNRGGEEVVDPYYGADNGFEVVYEQVERFSNAFLRDVVVTSGNDKGSTHVNKTLER